MTHCEAHPHVNQMYPCEECMADYWAELDYIADQKREYEAYQQEMYEDYILEQKAQHYREKCLAWLDYTQHGTPLPDWYYYA